MDKQQKRMVFQYHDNTEINYAFGFFQTDSGGQTPGDFEGQNRASNVRGSKQILNRLTL